MMLRYLRILTTSLRGVHAYSGSGDCTNLSAAVDQRQLRCDQSFEDRWSIIPKAHAEEPQDTDQRTSPVPPAQPPTETTGSAAANGCRKANPRRARWFDDWDLSGAAFPERHRLLVSFRKKRRAVRHSTQKCEPPLIATSFGTEVRATNVANNKSLVITITDRGPHTPDRVLDLSLNAARILGITDRGVAEIRAEVL
jgi:rare lipoprotein A